MYGTLRFYLAKSLFLAGAMPRTAIEDLTILPSPTGKKERLSYCKIWWSSHTMQCYSGLQQCPSKWYLIPSTSIHVHANVELDNGSHRSLLAVPEDPPRGPW